MIPKSEDLNALFGQEEVSLFVACSLFGKSVSTAIQLHGKSGLDAEEIQKIDAARVVTAELEF